MPIKYKWNDSEPILLSEEINYYFDSDILEMVPIYDLSIGKILSQIIFSNRILIVRIRIYYI